MPTAIHDIFRFIKLYSPDGSTLEQTLEADAINDTLQMRRGDGVSWSVPTTSPGGTIAVTVGFHTGTGQATGAFYLDGTERNTITLVKGQTYIFDQSDASNAGYGGYNHPMTFSNTDDGAVSSAISGEEYATGVTYLIDDNPVSKTIYKQDFTTTTNRKIKIELNDSAPGTLYYCSHDNIDQGGQILTTAGNDLMMINVDYSLDVPPGTTNIELTDVNAETTHVELSSAGGIQLTRKNANEIEISSFAVAEIDTLHTVTTRNAITTNKLYIEDIEVGDVTSATQDGFVSPSSEFLGTGRVDDALRLAIDQREITTNTVTQTFTFNSQAAPGVLNYTIGYQLDSGTSATSVTASIQRYNTVTTIWETLDTVSGVGGVPYEVSNMYNEASASGGQYRVVYNISGNTGTITLELQAYYEIFEITNNPVLRTESAVGTLRTRDLAPLGVNDIGRGSEPYDNVYANTFHGHLIGTFDGDLTGSLYTDDSTLLVDATSGTIYGSTLADTTSVIGNVEFADEVRLRFGASNELEIYHDGTNNIIKRNNGKILVQGYGTRFENQYNNQPFLEHSAIGYDTGDYGWKMYHTQYGTAYEKLKTLRTGIDVTGEVTASLGFVGDLTGSVYGPDSTTVIDNNGTVIGEVNNPQVTTANLEAGNFTDTIGTITNGNITGFNNVSAVNFTGNYTGSFFDDGSTMLIDGMRGRIVGTVDADTNKTGALTIASDTSVAVNGTGVISFNSGVGVDANGKLVNSSNAAQPFTIGSPVTFEREARSFPGAQEVMLYTNVSTGTYAIDTTATQNVYWNQPSGALVANFTGLETSTQKVRRVRIHINQGGTAYIPTIEVNGVTQTPTDLGTITGAANSLNIYEYTFYRTHTNAWEIYRQQLDAGNLNLDLDDVLGNGSTTAQDFGTDGKFNANELEVSLSGTVYGNFTSTATPAVGTFTFKDGDLRLESNNIIHPDGTAYVQWKSTTQKMPQTTTPSGVTAFSFTDTDTHYVYQPSAAWTPNITNIPNVAQRVTNIRFFVIQTATPHVPSSCQIDGVAQTISWQNGVTPTGTASGIDFVQLTVIQTVSGVSPTYVVIGQSNSYS